MRVAVRRDSYRRLENKTNFKNLTVFELETLRIIKQNLGMYHAK